ncbi:MAG: small multi-drug export protein [Deltaproteobacteria bacterium]|nr:small multi-drug export protein [Deltaproteobacteria bacterium]
MTHRIKEPCIDLSSEAFCPLPKWLWATFTFGPLGVFGLILLLVGLIKGVNAMWFIGGMTVGGFVGGGKLVVLAGAIENAPMGAWPIAAMVLFGDLSTAFILVANMHHLYKMPAFGPRLAALRKAGHQVLATHKWMRRAAEFGIIVFVALPFQGTGSVLGVFLGRILGLSRRVLVLCIAAGSAIGAGGIALLANMGRSEITQIAQKPVLGIITVSITLIATFILGKKFLGQDISE